MVLYQIATKHFAFIDHSFDKDLQELLEHLGDDDQLEWLAHLLDASLEKIKWVYTEVLDKKLGDYNPKNLGFLEFLRKTESSKAQHRLHIILQRTSFRSLIDLNVQNCCRIEMTLKGNPVLSFEKFRDSITQLIWIEKIVYHLLENLEKNEAYLRNIIDFCLNLMQRFPEEALHLSEPLITLYSK